MTMYQCTITPQKCRYFLFANAPPKKISSPLQYLKILQPCLILIREIIAEFQDQTVEDVQTSVVS